MTPLDATLITIALIVLGLAATVSGIAFKAGGWKLAFGIGPFDDEDDHTPTDVDERTLRLADEVDRLQEENDQLAAELVKERALVSTAAGSLRAYIGTHGEECSWGRECKSLTDAKEILRETDIDPRKVTPQAVSKPVDIANGKTRKVTPQAVSKSGDSRS